jgi:crotonobetainyl-CoA:carnitine CoA-transferase CaiB-like acyl-CoA transferase
VQRSRDLAERDPQIAHRGMRPRVTHPILGELTVDGVPVRFSRTPAGVKSAGPLLGGANRDVYSGLLGLPDGEIDELETERVLW